MMLREEARNVSIIVGGSIGMTLVLVGGFVLLCTASWAVMWAMDWTFVQLGMSARFGSGEGPAGLEILLGAFLLLTLRGITRVARADDR